MVILGVGVDIIECERVEALIAEHGERFLGRVFTEEEAAYCRAQRRPAEHFAARFAAKEAVLKALGTGWAPGTSWREVRIDRDPTGRPTVQLLGRTAETARRMGVRHIHLSISHCAHYALAQAIATGDQTSTQGKEWK